MIAPPTCEKDGQLLREDLTFRAQLATYGIPRTRCTAGHSSYHDYARAREPRRPKHCCALCGEPIGQGRKCELCRGQRWR